MTSRRPVSMSCARSIFAAGVIATVSGAVNAETIVSWSQVYREKMPGNVTYRGGSLTNSPQIVSGIDVNGDGRVTNETLVHFRFSMTEPLNPLPPYHVEYDSAIFYGGLVGRYVNVDYAAGKNPISQATVQHEPNADRTGYISRMTFDHYAPAKWYILGDKSDDLTNFSAAFMWRKDGFLNGGSSGVVSFDASSNLSVNLVRWHNPGQARFVVQDGDQFYISEATLPPPTGGTHQQNNVRNVNPTLTNWALYDPVGPYDIDFDQNTAVFAPHVFTDVQAVGAYFERDAFINVLNLPAPSNMLKFDNFIINAVVTGGTGAPPTPEYNPIPEPSVLALVGMGWAASMSRRRLAKRS